MPILLDCYWAKYMFCRRLFFYWIEAVKEKHFWWMLIFLTAPFIWQHELRIRRRSFSQDIMWVKGDIWQVSPLPESWKSEALGCLKGCLTPNKEKNLPLKTLGTQSIHIQQHEYETQQLDTVGYIFNVNGNQRLCLITEFSLCGSLFSAAFMLLNGHQRIMWKIGGVFKCLS